MNKAQCKGMLGAKSSKTKAAPEKVAKVKQLRGR